MPNTKEQVRAVLDQLPDDCTMEQVQYHLYVADLIRERVRMSEEEEEGIPHAEIVKRVEAWNRKSSRSSGLQRPLKTSKTSGTTSTRVRPLTQPG